jgi:hypothetical protein
MKALIVTTDSEAMAEPEVEDTLAFLRKVRDAAGEGDLAFPSPFVGRDRVGGR